MEELDERTAFVRGPVVLFRWRNAPGWPVEHVSPNVVEVFGYPPEDLVSGRLSYGSLVEPEDAERVGREVAEASSSALTGFTHAPYRIRHRDGGVRWLLDVTRIARGPDGVPTHYLGYVIDITDRVVAEQQARALERQLLQAQKLESLGVLAGGLAHDFNNLLTGILGHASLAKRRACPECQESVRESLEEIEQLSRRAARLTQQLLSYAGRGVRVRAPVDLREVVERALELLELAPPRATHVRVECEGEVPPVEADRQQMEQLVVNLLTNAGEALEGREGREGCVVLRLFAEADGEARSVVLEVEDTGNGMGSEAKARLFDPFFTTKEAGRGLGMAAVLGIVRSHAGVIDVHSEPGRGCLVRVRLPATSGALTRDARAASSRRAPSRGLVLVIDDDAAVRSSLGPLLRHLGYAALVAAGGEEGLALHDQHRAELSVVLLDLTMPGLSGPETFAALHARDPSLPIVISSGYSAEHDPVIERAAAFLQKPYDVESLERVLAATIRSTSSPGTLDPA